MNPNGAIEIVELERVLDQKPYVELAELELALTGGGSGDVIFG